MSNKRQSKDTTRPANPHKNNTATPTNSETICEFCRRKFSRKDNLNRHLQKYCKKNKIELIILQNPLLKNWS